MNEISTNRRDLYLTKQHSKGTGIHARVGIRTRNPSKRAAVDPRPGPHEHRDRLKYLLSYLIIKTTIKLGVVIIKYHHSYQLHTHTLSSRGNP
jgi:hypothetical protein